jgi:cytochrome c oxidase cbb3-type subunit IV
MDIGLLRSAVTVLSLCVFVGIMVWAFSRRNKAHFEEAAKLPFAED